MLFRAGGQRTPKDSVDRWHTWLPDARRRLPGPDMPGTGVPRSPVQVETITENATPPGWPFVADAQVPIINDMIRADRQREAQVSDDRRLQEFSHDEGRLGYVAVPRSGVPCSLVQVSRDAEIIMFFSFPFSFFFLDSYNTTEPVGSVRPKFPSISNINGLVTSTNGTLPLLCPAQGFPVPSYRYYIIKCLGVTRVS